MAVIVTHKKSGQKYILLGTGFGAIRTMQESPMYGTLRPSEESFELKMVAVCNNLGKIEWVHSEEIEVVEIGGSFPSELL